MHEEFRNTFKDRDLSFSVVEDGIKCPKNYLSRFINGPKELPAKWEKKIREFLKTTALASKAGIVAKDAEKFFQKAWVPTIENYCLEEAGIDPEGLIEQHRSLKKKVAELSAVQRMPPEAAVQVKDITAAAAKSNVTINTTGRSNWMEEYRKKKLGLKD